MRDQRDPEEIGKRILSKRNSHGGKAPGTSCHAAADEVLANMEIVPPSDNRSNGACRIEGREKTIEDLVLRKNE